MTTKLAKQHRAQLRCNSLKWGEYNELRCVADKGHTGDHCYVPVITKPATKPTGAKGDA